MNRNTFFVLFLLISNLVSGQDLKLWYSQPAQNWSEALPIGNSRLGAMVYGGIEREELQLNEETFWAGSPYNNNNPNAVHVLPIVRKLIFEGRNKEAQRLIDANFLTQQHGMSYLTLGSLYLEFPEHQNASGFYRDLNLENATTTTRYQVDDVTYTRTTFASFTDNVIIMHIKASKANALNFTIAYNFPLVHKVNVQNDKLTVTCQGKEQEVSKQQVATKEQKGSRKQPAMEIIVNDWAMPALLHGKPHLKPVLGVLLNKRRKDVRLPYKHGIGNHVDSLAENNLNCGFYQNYLKNTLNIQRFEFESCGYKVTIPDGHHSLHLPFYQTNTSQYCTLYAKCMTGERGKQKLAEECPKFCKDYAFLYPDHLMMIGRYNSLFALDSRIFEDGSGSGTGTEIGTKIKTEEILKKWKKAGVDRLVVNLLDSGVKR